MTDDFIVLRLPNAETTHSFGMRLGQQLSEGSVLLLEGDLGSGKTTLVQGLGMGLGIEETIVSPTFTLINEYLDGRLPLYHLDLYRLQPLEIEALYLETYWEGLEVEPGIVAIEWADRLLYKPSNYVRIRWCDRTQAYRQANLHLHNCPNLDLQTLII